MSRLKQNFRKNTSYGKTEQRLILCQIKEKPEKRQTFLKNIKKKILIYIVNLAGRPEKCFKMGGHDDEIISYGIK